jgi:small subunit ribosomal protein S8e|tara:strand:- start:61 stop:486 length:426 start_codon:yes stop_codon:yes gene_type:complete
VFLSFTIIFINGFWKFKGMKSQFRSKRKASGGRYNATRKKKLREVAREPLYTRIGEKKVKTYRVQGGNQKKSLLRSKEANVLIDGKYKKVKVEEVVENQANRHFVRRNILTKGAIIKTEAGNAKVVNRPGQEGFINAILVK